VRVLLYLVGLAISMGIGAWIATLKNRAWWIGALLGILGIIGWIIAALLPKQQPAGSSGV
jgi:hypothetical protein